MASSNSQINKPQHRHPKRAELPNVNINTGAQSINNESLFKLDTFRTYRVSEFKDQSPKALTFALH